MAEKLPLTPKHAKYLKNVENEISVMLHDLEVDTELSIDRVDVDTRNFGQLKVEIKLTKRPRQ